MSVSIIIPHYKTESLAKLCLRSIRHYTKGDYEVVVVDNGSGNDPALNYLRRVNWIKLIERNADSLNPLQLFDQTFDIGIECTTKPYVLFFHTDSIPIHPNWLNWLLENIQLSEKIYAVGSYKLEIKTPFQHFLKLLENKLGLGKMPLEGTPENPFYIRGHCALYRREVFNTLGLRYKTEGTHERNLHFAIKAAGYEAKLLEPYEMLKYVVHLNHGTMVLNPEFGVRKKTMRKGKTRIEKFLSSQKIQSILQDSSLDT